MQYQNCRISHVQIKNFLGIEDLDLTPTQLTLVTGANAVGKSSVLEAIAFALTNKGQRPRLVREGSDKSVLLVELDNGWQVTRTLKAGETSGTVKVKFQTGYTVDRPQSALSELVGVNAYQFNPVAFLSENEKRQAEILLTAMPIQMDYETRLALTAGQEQLGLDYDAHPLQFLKDLEEGLVAQRRDINAEAKAAKGIIDQWEDDKPEGFDPEAVAAQTSHNVFGALAEAQQRNKMIAVNQHKVDRLEEQIRGLEAQQAQEKQWLVANPPLDLTPLEEAAQSYDEQKALLGDWQDTQRAQEETKSLSTQAETLSAQIEAVRELPTKLLKETPSPIEGLGFEGGKVVINGRPITALSHSERIRLAVQVAEATAGALKLVLVDGLEALDDETRAAFLETIQDSECQYIVTQVADDGLTIEQPDIAAFEEELQ